MPSTRFNVPLDARTILGMVYPVGSIYMSVSSTSPATLFGGTWQQLENRFLVGASADSAESPAYPAGTTGGAASQSYTPVGTVGGHTLTTDEIPSHAHGLNSHTHSVGAHNHGLNSHTHTYTDYYANGTSGTNNGNTGSTAINFSNGYAAAKAHDSGTAGKAYFGYKYPGGNVGYGRYAMVGTGGSTAYKDASSTEAGSLGGSQSHTHTLNSHSHSVTNTSASRTSDQASGNTANSSAFDSGAASGDTASNGGGGSHDHGFTGTEATITTIPPFLAVYMWKRTA